MRFGKAVLLQSYSRRPDFDSLDSLEKSFNFGCVNCLTKIEVKYKTIIGKEFSWHEEFDAKTYEEIKRLYDMNAVGKTPDGGWTAIDKCQCNNCQTQYLIYAGEDEYYNSLYKITLQGITEILDESAKNRI